MIDNSTEIVLRLHVVVAGPDDDEVHSRRADLLIDAACAPLPTATIVSTVATPIVMPTIVSAVCSRLRPSASNATERQDRIDINASALRSFRSCRQSCR